MRKCFVEPIADKAFVGDIDWADQEIEVVETAEHAVAKKTARIVEEVELKKVGSDHVETIRDKIRRQQVEIERVGSRRQGHPGEDRLIALASDGPKSSCRTFGRASGGRREAPCSHSFRGECWG